MKTTHNTLRQAYDRLSQAMSSYKSAATGNESNREAGWVANVLADVAALADASPRKGSATELHPRFVELVDRAREMVDSHGPEAAARRDDYRAKLMARDHSGDWTFDMMMDSRGNVTGVGRVNPRFTRL